MRWFLIKTVVAFLGLLPLYNLAVAQALEPLRLMYYERKPFNYMDNGGNVVGLTADPAAKIFAAAGIPIVWQVRSANAILDALQNNTAAICSPGWYYSAERASYAQFTQPIYRDKPLVGLANVNFKYQMGTTAKDLLGRSDVRLMIKQNFVYGPYLDNIIAKIPVTQLISEAAEVSDIVRLIHLGRADLSIVTQEEVELYVANAQLKMTDFKILKFTDIPAAEMRYIMCSKKVPAATIDALNAAIAKTVQLSR